MKIPTQGLARQDVLKTLDGYRAQDMDRHSGKAFGYVYIAGEEASALGREVHSAFLGLNAMDPTLFPSLLQIENDVVAMCAAHTNAPSDAVGTFTSGGTESIILSVKAARDAFRSRRPDIDQPEMIVATTTHAAFHKAGAYLGVKVVSVPVDPVTMRMNVDAARDAIGPNTILLVGSAPSYAHGVIDPIEELGQLALEHELLLHVDGCIGAFLLPYLERLGQQVPRFDFRVPGVTSLSMDLHKFAYAPKGASILLFSDPDLRRHQMFACAGWTGYSLVNTAVQSSKTGAPMAAAWAVLRFLGDEGYLALAQLILTATQEIGAGIDDIEGLEPLGRPDMGLIAFTAGDLNVFHLADEIKLRGWHVQPQLTFENVPASIHLTVTPANAHSAQAFLSDLRDAVAEVRRQGVDPELEMIRGVVQTIDFDQLDGEALMNLLTMVNGGGEPGLPSKMAHVNEALNGMSTSGRERLLVEYFHQLFRPSEPDITPNPPLEGQDVHRPTA
jgi:sphinganine-1-phosphate aldolase